MKRHQLFEYEDLPWFPRSLRNYGTEFLEFMANKADFYKEIIPILKKGVERSGHKKIIDLAAGGGGGWKAISPRLKDEIPDLKITLTDHFPNSEAFKRMLKYDRETFFYVPESVDARKVPKQLTGLRTMFLSFHHFDPADAKSILQDAVDSNAAIAVFEVQERDMANVLKNMLSPFMVLLATPFIRPFSIGRLVFTYLVPIVPLFILWDGVVSVLRTYSLDEMRTMTKELDKRLRFKWEIEKIQDGPLTIQYLLGYPKKKG